MLGKAKSNKSLSATVGYNMKAGSEFFFSNMLEGDEIRSFKWQMADLHKCYDGTGENLIIHAQLSPEIEEGKRLQAESWKRIATAYLQKMGLQSHQAIGFLHRDKKHVHAHLIINRINEFDFLLYNDSFVGIRSSKAADEIAIEMGLTRASEIGREKLRRKQDTTTENQDIGAPKGSKERFKADLEQVLQQGHVDLEAYFRAVENDGYKLKKYLDKETGKLRGYGVEKNGTFMHASDIDRKLTINKLSFGDNNVVLEKAVATKPKPEIPEEQKRWRRR